ncbi:MAG: fasciclin domain-containing protein [Chloroflexales bacterium]
MSADTLADVIAGTPDLSIFASLLRVAGLDGVLRGSGPYTLFAPTDEAFAQLRPGVLAALYVDPPRLRDALSDHIVSGALVAADLMDVLEVTALSGARLTITSAHGLRVEQRYLTQADQITANGVLHRIGALLQLR